MNEIFGKLYPIIASLWIPVKNILHKSAGPIEAFLYPPDMTGSIGWLAEKMKPVFG
jgi:hypothetical protein